ncbi:RNA-directed DNA polymerase, eukaryota, reverse transcriptase zinc-binding domain protein [Tanacetum coccineum]
MLGYEMKYNLRRMWGKYGLGEIVVDENELCFVKFKSTEREYELYLEYKGISTISSRLGKPLMMDQMIADMCNKATGRLGHAKVLVEIEAAKGFLDSIEINYVFGHNHFKCDKRPRTLEVNGKGKITQNIKMGRDGFTEVRNRRFSNVNGGNEGYQGINNAVNNLNGKFMFRPKIPSVQERKENQNAKDKQKVSGNLNGKTTRVEKVWNIGRKNVEELKKNANKYDVFSVENTDGADKSREELMTSKRLMLDEFVKRKAQLNFTDTNDWSYDMVNYFKYAWEAMERKDVENSDEEDVEENIECVVQTLIANESKQTILCIVKTIPKKIKTFVNCVYASNNGIERMDLWNTLELDKRVVGNHSWAIMRDFNVTLKLDEHSNEGSGLSCEMQEFNEAVNNLEVDDLCSSGFHFTWTKSLKNPENATLKKLDKIMVNDSRKHKSRVESICDENGTRHWGKDVAKQIVKHFQGFLGAASSVNSFDQLGDIVNLKLSEEDVEAMIEEVSNKEIKEAMEFFINGKMLGEVNATLDALVPKIETPTKFLISCISKILTNKIKKGLNKVVSINQSAFIPGKHIQDNILLTQELFRGYKRCAMKIDIQKAYDTVSWKFLEDVLLKVGFHRKRTETKGSYFPYLFTIFIEVLNMIMIKNIKADNKFEYHYGWKELKLTHLCFADDLLMLCNGDVDSLRVVKKSLDEFSKKEMLEIMNFKCGKLPMKYLGVSLLAKILGVNDYRSLVETKDERLVDLSINGLSDKYEKPCSNHKLKQRNRFPNLHRSVQWSLLEEMQIRNKSLHCSVSTNSSAPQVLLTETPHRVQDTRTNKERDNRNNNKTEFISWMSRMPFCMDRYLRPSTCINLLVFETCGILIMFAFYSDHFIGLNRPLGPSFSDLQPMLLGLIFFTVDVTHHFLFTNRALLQRIIASLHEEFSMTDLGPLNYFLGVFVTRNTSGMFLSQQKYATEVLKPAGALYSQSGSAVMSLGTLTSGLQLYSSTTSSLVAYSDAYWAGILLFLDPSTEQVSGVANAVAETCWLPNLLRPHTGLHVPSTLPDSDIHQRSTYGFILIEFHTAEVFVPLPLETQEDLAI